MANATIDKVRGMVDLLPDEHAVQQAVGATLEAHIADHGYRTVELPVLEQTDLYLRKVGQEMAGKLYAFRHRNRDLCLRPELTASVMRAFVSYFQNAALPLRLAYRGPVFRYEAPQRGRYRQFTEIGTELIGASAPLADAEVIALAAAGLDRVGLHDYRVVVGHIGIAQAYLAGLTLDERVRDWLTWSMEDLRQHGADHLPPALGALLPGANGITPDEAEPIANDDGWSTLPPDEAERVVLRVLRGAGLDLSGSSRTPEEIARRLVGKLARQRANHDVATALAFLRRLAHLRGTPDEVVLDLRALLAEEQLDDAPLRQVEQVLDYLAAFGLPRERITLDAGLGRGLHFYTGLIFEIEDSASGAQLAGGGRYDDLAVVLGARERVPACGFAYGLERIVEALTARDLAPAAAPVAPDVLVCTVSLNETAYAIRVARSLRAEGRHVELDVRQRGVRANLEIANRRALPAVVIIGEAEQREGVYVWRDMANHREERRALPAPSPE